jgi:hypothetical protein
MLTRSGNVIRKSGATACIRRKALIAAPLNKMDKMETMGMMKRKRNQGRAAEPVATGLGGRDTIGPVTDW